MFAYPMMLVKMTNEISPIPIVFQVLDLATVHGDN